MNAIQAKSGSSKHRDVLLLRAFSSPGYNQHDGINKLHGVRRVTFTYDGLGDQNPSSRRHRFATFG